MNDNINFRTFKEGDYETCCKWWNVWWAKFGGEPIRRAFLPRDEKCYIIEKNNIPIAASFLYVMHDVPILAWNTYLVSNPKYKEKDRRKLIQLLLKNIEQEAEKHGILQMFTICGDVHVTKIYRDIGWDLAPVKYEGFKYIENNLKKIDKNYGEKR